jgi:hypothetical protein
LDCPNYVSPGILDFYENYPALKKVGMKKGIRDFAFSPWRRSRHYSPWSEAEWDGRCVVKGFSAYLISHSLSGYGRFVF